MPSVALYDYSTWRFSDSRAILIFSNRTFVLFCICIRRKITIKFLESEWLSMTKQAERSFVWRLFIIATPILFQNMLSASLNFIDVFMIGSLGETSVAAVGSANQFFSSLTCWSSDWQAVQPYSRLNTGALVRLKTSVLLWASAFD